VVTVEEQHRGGVEELSQVRTVYGIGKAKVSCPVARTREYLDAGRTRVFPTRRTYAKVNEVGVISGRHADHEFSHV